ncbi:hypothetical protein PG993_009153 [Apiospora rasikravindrae]|uniref:F-box domain-containing protein n=1 Tax=Apiospora rasikravindrae TaxID=990691 RepID=A0ABR1SKZ6_9PEZI
MATSNIVPCDADIDFLKPWPGHRLRGMIQLTGQMPQPQCTPLPQRHNPSPGLLGRLPLELMLDVVEHLDFQSITRFSTASVQANACVQSCRKYRDVLRLVPEAVVALRRLGLLDLHSVLDLYSVLRADGCAICGELGPFLFLPTCQRCCEGCRSYYPSLRLMTSDQARMFYGLSKGDTNQLRQVHITPAIIKGGRQSEWASWTAGGTVVIAQAARDRSLAVHGSSDNVCLAALENCIPDYVRKARYWTAAQNVRPREEWRVGRTPLYDDFRPEAPDLHDFWPQVPYATMATMYFPTLTKDGDLQYAMWCAGCQMTSHSFDSYRRPGKPRKVPLKIQEEMRRYLPPSTAQQSTTHLRSCSVWQTGLGGRSRSWDTPETALAHSDY